MDYGQINEYEFEIPNPRKLATVRLPTGEEMLERMRVQKTLQTDLGRRRTQSEFIRNPEAELKLFNAIRRDQGEPFDADEAEHVIGILTNAEVVDAKQEGGGFTVTLDWSFFASNRGTTVHHLKVPTMGQLKRYQLAIVRVYNLPHGKTEFRYNIAAAVELYDQLTTAETTGYAPGVEVPPHHKSAVVGEVNQMLQNPGAGADPEGF